MHGACVCVHAGPNRVAATARERVPSGAMGFLFPRGAWAAQGQHMLARMSLVIRGATETGCWSRILGSFSREPLGSMHGLTSSLTQGWMAGGRWACAAVLASPGSPFQEAAPQQTWCVCRVLRQTSEINKVMAVQHCACACTGNPNLFPSRPGSMAQGPASMQVRRHAQMRVRRPTAPLLLSPPAGGSMQLAALPA